MVGSGFSRNAQPRQQGLPGTPSWSALASAMQDKLNPGNPASSKPDASLLDPLKVAQQYETAFGRGELHRFLRQRINDENVSPGEFHRRLLALPWTDVFTTNWDTLLDRARHLVAARTYHVVRDLDEIPLAPRPRIVKLHGSLPAHFPLVVTEEDYRRYPVQLAPFVNTAQQAMMETVFLLIGFSGSDPNFLHWSGWVRDQLGPSAPRIYLAGWFDFSRQERRVLEQKNVIPIDLALHPKRDSWLRHQQQHQFSVDWILRTLELGRSYPTVEWPRALSQPDREAPDHLLPVDGTAWVAPKPELELSPDQKDDEESAKAVNDVLSIWMFNRGLYPGWLVVPTERVPALRRLTDNWEEVLLAGVENGFVDRMQVVHEVMWRREIMLEPLGEKLRCVAWDTVWSAAESKDASGDREVNPLALSLVACALVTDARVRFDAHGFEEAMDLASKLSEHIPDAKQRLHQERALWALYSMDFAGLSTALDAWDTDNSDVFWSVRKAALMFEAGFVQDVQPVVRKVLTSLRRAEGPARTVAVVSRESWSLHFLHALERSPWDDSDWSDRSTMGELARFKCDATEEIRQLALAVRTPPERDKGPGFELGSESRSSPTIYIGTPREDSRARAAYRVVRLGDLAGLPPSAGHWALTRYMLVDAAQALHGHGEIEFALRLMLRVTNYDGDDLLKKLLSRGNLAKIPTKIVHRLVETCERMIDYFMERRHSIGGTGSISPLERLRVAIECLSRLVLRLEADRSGGIFRKALEYYANDSLTHVWLRDCIRHLLERSWSALPESDRIGLVLDVLNAPIIGMDGFRREPFGRPDSGDLLETLVTPLPQRGGDSESRWRETVRFLTRGLESENEETRSRAMTRLTHVAMAERLAEDELVPVAQAIWSSARKGKGEPAGFGRLRSWVFLCVPEPAAGTGERWFRDKWLPRSGVAEVADDELNEALFHLGDVLESSEDRAYSLELSQVDSAHVLELFERWSERPVPSRLFLPFDNDEGRSLQNAINGVAVLQLHVDTPEAVAKVLVDQAKKLESNAVGISRLIVSQTAGSKDGNSIVSAEIRKRLWSNDARETHDALQAIAFWLRWSKRGRLGTPPNDLIREIGVVVATRRSVALVHALQIAEWIFVQGDEVQQEELRQLVLDGLGHLIYELNYAREDDAEEDVDVPFKRWGVVGLVHAMNDQGLGGHPIIAQWMEQIREDPLPEVRNSPSRIRL